MMQGPWIRRLIIWLLVGAMAAGVAIEAADAGDPLAKVLFGGEKLPAAAAPRSIGFYSKGCLSGGIALPTDGPTWQVMRLSRNRRWGHPAMIKLLEQFSRDAAAKDGWRGLLVGDISQARGGPMLDGHASHQIGLDADIWFTPMPSRTISRDERETMVSKSMLKKGSLYVDDRLWDAAHTAVLKRAASYPQIERILVNAGIKKKLCDTVKGDRSWLRKVRPFFGHDAHFHLRIGCQPGSPGCKEQAAVPGGDGCEAKSLNYWFTKAATSVDLSPDTPRARDKMTLKSLPPACRGVLDAPSPQSAEAATLGGPAAVIEASTPAPEPAPDTAPALASDDQPASPVNAFAPTPPMDIPMPRPRPKKN